jgi:hypothetical protein
MVLHVEINRKYILDRLVGRKSEIGCKILSKAKITSCTKKNTSSQATHWHVSLLSTLFSTRDDAKVQPKLFYELTGCKVTKNML